MSINPANIGKPPVLSISGSDSTGQSGIQADINTIAAMGGHALTAVSCITVQDSHGVHEMYDLPATTTLSQVASIMADAHPKAVKVGLVRDCKTIWMLRDELTGCRNLVLAPGIYASDGSMMMQDDAIQMLTTCLVPEAQLLMLRCHDAEKLLDMTITTDDDMKQAAERLHQMGAEWIMLRGGQHTEGRLTALLYGQGTIRFFTSYNMDGWQRHGVGGALSAAITTRLAMGDNIPTAIRNAHDYVHSRVVYAVRGESMRLRPADIYNAFMSLLSAHYRTNHDVAFYAERLNITTRYLSQITGNIISKSPKQIIADYLIQEAELQLENSRLSIKEIADRLGFTSTAAFCKFFKQRQGISPSGIR